MRPLWIAALVLLPQYLPEGMVGRTSRDVDASRLIPRLFGISGGRR